MALVSLRWSGLHSALVLLSLLKKQGEVGEVTAQRDKEETLSEYTATD